MTPKSSDVAEVAEEEVLMETENVVDSSSLGKSKAEEEEEEEEDEGEVTDESMETDDEDEPEVEPVWGYDSFEDKEYFSFSDNEHIEAFSDLDSVKPFVDYRRQIHKSRGFDVDPDSIPEDMITGYFPIDLNDTLFGWPKSPDGTARGYMERMVGLALSTSTTKLRFYLLLLPQTQGMDVKMEYVVRALARKSAGIKCYITFMARETPNASLVEYQAKTEWKIHQVHTYPIFCRPSPPVDLDAKVTKHPSFLQKEAKKLRL